VRESRRAMLKGQQLAAFRRRLFAWFREFQRDLPWRHTRDPYRVWLAEIMLQQTRVAAVIPYYERFLERFPNVQALAAAPEGEVLRRWSGLGYYRRARNLQKAARKIVADHDGEFPSRVEDVLALPGIGNYTAAAILSIAFEKRHAVLDGNVARVLARLGALRADLRASGRWQELQECADTLLDLESPGDWNQAMMELGATLCTPKSPQCLLCPVAQFCDARKLGIAERLPEKRAKRPTVEVHLAAAVFADEHGRTLLLPPPGERKLEPLADHVPALASNLWHFPTIAVNKDPVTKLRRHLERLRIQSGNSGFHFTSAGKVRHTVTYRSITVEPFRISVKRLPRIKGAERVPLNEVTVLPVSNLTRKVARAALAASPSLDRADPPSPGRTARTGPWHAREALRPPE
jgi:A/G-specific adenine glycosylase